MEKINIKRAYVAELPSDGFRVFVDRLWPRGLSHDTFHYDLWAKDIAPSTELREWYHADPLNRWEEFKDKYIAELKASDSFHSLEGELRSHPVVTLIYGSRDTLHNNAVIVKEALDDNL